MFQSQRTSRGDTFALTFALRGDPLEREISLKPLKSGIGLGASTALANPEP